VLRGTAAAGSSAALAVAGHAVAGGALPPAGLTVVLTALLAGAGVALADRQRGLGAILAAVGGSQLAMHVLLERLGHAHAGGTDRPVLMFVGHAVAAVVVACALAGAERSVFAVVAVLRWLLRGVTVAAGLPPLPGAGTTVVAAGPSGSITVDVVLRRVNARRGPPGRG
jgi:hypothetical protein